MTRSEPAPPRPRGAGLSLIGYRGSGKSRVGPLLARLANRPFVDLDALIEARAQSTIAQLFASRGEAGFRDLEAAALQHAALHHPTAVIAPGGGAVLRLDNRQTLRQHGLVVWLETSAPTIIERLQADPAGRPALTPQGLLQEVRDLLEQRTPLYRALGDVVVQTDQRSPSQIAEHILRAWSPSAADQLAPT
jgi:shikimate kinase